MLQGGKCASFPCIPQCLKELARLQYPTDMHVILMRCVTVLLIMMRQLLKAITYFRYNSKRKLLHCKKIENEMLFYFYITFF